MEIAQVLLLIEQYVESLPREALSGAYDSAAKDLFTWLRESGCGRDEVAIVCSIIQRETGYHPSQIRSSQDAEVLTMGLYGSLNSEAIGRRIQSVGKGSDRIEQALRAVRFGFSRSDSPVLPEELTDE